MSQKYYQLKEGVEKKDAAKHGVSFGLFGVIYPGQKLDDKELQSLNLLEEVFPEDTCYHCGNGAGNGAMVHTNGCNCN